MSRLPGEALDVQRVLDERGDPTAEVPQAASLRRENRQAATEGLEHRDRAALREGGEYQEPGAVHQSGQALACDETRKM